MKSNDNIELKPITEGLYSVTTIAKQLKHRGFWYENVSLTWFIEKRDYPVKFDFLKLIKRCPDAYYPQPVIEAMSNDDEIVNFDHSKYIEDSLDVYVKLMIEDSFTKGEAEALIAYLEKKYGDNATHSIDEIELPLEQGQCGVGAIPYGGDTGRYFEYKAENYSLPFDASGFYRIDREEMEKNGDDGLLHL